MSRHLPWTTIQVPYNCSQDTYLRERIAHSKSFKETSPKFYFTCTQIKVFLQEYRLILKTALCISEREALLKTQLKTEAQNKLEKSRKKSAKLDSAFVQLETLDMARMIGKQQQIYSTRHIFLQIYSPFE
jgi:hypothetical protein